MFCYENRTKVLVHYVLMQVEEYFGSGTWLLAGGSSWLEEVKELLTVKEHQCPVYLHQEHNAAQETISCILHLLKGESNEEKGWKKVLSLLCNLNIGSSKMVHETIFSH